VEWLESDLATLRDAHQALKTRAVELERALEAEQSAVRQHALQDQTSAAELEQALDALEEAQEALAAAQAAAPPAAPTEAIQAALREQLAQRVETLQRVIDAIERTDISALGTVDRIRLQSALRDTAPARTLGELRELLAQPQQP
jgi:hypothetical protein